jgi:glycosyltransferase involved in cell wall biosynthesis
VISVVIPVYNNAATLEELARRIDAALAPRDYEIIFVNDGSSDASLERLRRIAAGNSRVRLIALARNFGQHPAISAGFEHAAGDAIVLMDADLQDRPEDIPAMLDKMRDGIDIVYTRKAQAAEGAAVRITSSLYHYVFSRITGSQRFADIGTLRAFNRKFLAAVLQYRERNVLYGPLMVYMGFNSDFVDVVRDARPSGRSGYTFAGRLALAVNTLISYTDIPHRIFIFVGLALFAGSMLYSGAVLLQYALYGRALPEGFTLILLMLTLMLGSLMLGLGIIGSYVFRAYQEVLQRPRYLIAEKINFGD